MESQHIACFDEALECREVLGRDVTEGKPRRRSDLAAAELREKGVAFRLAPVRVLAWRVFILHAPFASA